MSIRLIHTSDWHLGKKIFKRSRIPEQKMYLEWLTQELIEKQIDLLVISGDIFDTPTPPNDAVALYYEFLFNASENTQTKIIIIPGNHDSASFISAPLQLLKKHHIHIVSGIENCLQKNHLQFTIRNQSVVIKALPYFRTYELYNAIQKPQQENIDKEDIHAFMQDFFSYWPEGHNDALKIIMAHHAFGNYAAAGSEQALMLSGLESIPLDWLGNEFHYMALGHIHMPQTLSKEKNIYYSGSPIPLRFSEKHNKKINLVEYSNNLINVQGINIPIFRPIIQIKSTKDKIYSKIDEQLAANSSDELMPFIEVVLQTDIPDNHFSDSLFEYIKSKGAILLSFIPQYSNLIQEESDNFNNEIVDQSNIVELFKNYYKSKFPKVDVVPENIINLFVQNLEELKDEDSITND